MMQLANSQSVADTNRLHNLAHEIMEIPIDYHGPQNVIRRYSVHVQHSADSCKLRHISFYADSQLTTEQFKDLQKNSTFEILIGGIRFIKVNLSLLMELTEVKKIGNNFVVTIPHEYTIGEILLISSRNFDTRLNLELNCQHITNVKIFAQYTFYDENVRNTLRDNEQKRMCQLIENADEHFWTNQAETRTRLSLNHNGFTKGYFIEGDIDKIKGLQLELNGHDRFEMYDEVAIGLYCDRISDRLLFLPFNNDIRNNYKNMTLESYTGAMDASRIDTIRLKILLNPSEMESTLKVYAMTCNFMIYSGGFVRLEDPGTNARTLIDTINPQAILNLRNMSAIQNTEIWPITERELTSERDNICAITYNPIESEYGMCLACNNTFDYEAIRRWLGQRSSCPMCRCNWTNKIKYTRIVVDAVQLQPVVQTIVQQETVVG